VEPALPGVYSIEVERAIAANDAVAEVAVAEVAVVGVAVVGVPNDRWGERVHALVVPAVGAALTEHDIIEHCGWMIAGYKVPKSVDVRTDPSRSLAQGRSSNRTSEGKCTLLGARTDEQVIPPQPPNWPTQTGRTALGSYAKPTAPRACAMLMPSTPFASPQVVSRRFTLFRVPGIGVSAGQLDFCSGFDSRQLH
jgi:AMP-binding enzyme C-terminal domain